jgi:probable HAF family extracellular repeat protein
MPESEYTVSWRGRRTVAGLVHFIAPVMVMLALLVALLTTLSRAALASSPTSQLRYAVVDLGTLSGDDISTAFTISDSGYIAGASGTTSTQQAVSWRNGAITDLGAPPADSASLAVGINLQGELVGGAFNFTTRTSLPYSWPRGAPPQILPTLGVTNALASGINDLGEVAGFASPTTVGDLSDAFGRPYQRHTTVWNHGVIRDLGTLGGPSSQAGGRHPINNRGDVAGTADVDTTMNPVLGVYRFHAALWTQTTGPHPVVTDLGVLARQADNSISFAEGINELGQVVGWSLTDVSDTCFGGPQQWGFLWQRGVMRGLPPLAGDCDAVAEALNNRGQVVGVSQGVSATGKFVQRPVIWSNNQAIELNALIPTSSGWTLSYANGINDAGEIVGYGINPQGMNHAFLLRPRLGITGTEEASGATLSSSAREGSQQVASQQDALSQRDGSWSLEVDLLRMKGVKR